MESAFGAVEGIRRNYIRRHHKLHLHWINLTIFNTSESFNKYVQITNWL